MRTDVRDVRQALEGGESPIMKRIMAAAAVLGLTVAISLVGASTASASGICGGKPTTVTVTGVNC